MVVFSTALVLAAEESAAQGSVTPPYVFGAFAFIALSALLVATWMIKVGKD